MSKALFGVLCVVALFLTGCQSPAGEQAGLRLNEVQYLGSHNSYKQPIDDVLLAQLRSRNSPAAVSLDYSHAPLEEQLDLGLRKLELDVFHDPEGGRYARPFGAGLPGANAFDMSGRMNAPGFKVLHVQDIDFRSHCLTLKDCLQAIRDWSDANPDHFPLLVTINAKTGVIDQPGFVEPLPFDEVAWDTFDAEVRDVLADRLLVPDDIRGDYSTLRDAVQAGWPPVNEVRGKIMLLLDDSDAKKQAYAAGHPSLRDRVMFIDASEDSDEGSIRIVNNPVEREDYIRGLVEDGFIVRTRSDADTREARSGDYRRYEAALRSGAQIISTDYYRADTRLGDFLIEMPGSIPIRCNPVLVATSCEVNP